MDETSLDRAHAAMTATPTDRQARLAYYHRLADCELYLLLSAEPEDVRFDPAIYPLEDGRFALAFDSEERLAAFGDGPVPYAALPGRVLVAALAGQGVGLGLNLGVADSAFLMPPEALDWLADALTRAPEAGGGRPREFFPPTLPGFAAALSDKLAGLATLAPCAWLAGAWLADGHAGHVIIYEAARPEAHDALAKAAAEAVLFAGLAPEGVEVMFLSARRIAAEGLPALAEPVEISPPRAVDRASAGPAAPGSDPARPPRLR